MRYFIISDVHGQCMMMIEALQKAGFNKETDTLIHVGDAFDRGPNSKEVLDFFLSCPNRILIWGNHDLRLNELVFGRDIMYDYDLHNGVDATCLSFAGETEKDITYTDAFEMMRENESLKQYWKELCYAVEFPDLIITHGWLPTTPRWEGSYAFEMVNPNWRECDSKDWTDATWANTEMMCRQKLFPEKKILVGHWHAWRIAEHYMEKRFTDRHTSLPQIDCSIYEYKDKAIFIDGMSNYPKGGCVNVYIYETDASPVCYR